MGRVRIITIVVFAFALAIFQAVEYSQGDSKKQLVFAPAPNSPLYIDPMVGQPPETCPVTQAPDLPFTPPPPYPATPPGGGSFWFGTEQLWTMLPADGTWRGLPHYRPTDPGYRQKIFWWHEGYDWRAEPRPNLTVRGKRLDAPAPPLVASRATNGFRAEDLKSFMLVGVDIPTLGCWEITGEIDGQELTFVVWVSE
jgi:hypothetical protein